MPHLHRAATAPPCTCGLSATRVASPRLAVAQAAEQQLSRVELLVKLEQHDEARLVLRQGAFSSLRMDLGYGQEVFRVLQPQVRGCHCVASMQPCCMHARAQTCVLGAACVLRRTHGLILLHALVQTSCCGCRRARRTCALTPWLRRRLGVLWLRQLRSWTGS